MASYSIRDATTSISFEARQREWPKWCVVGRIEIEDAGGIEFTLEGRFWRRASAVKRAAELGNALTLAGIDSGKEVRALSGERA